MYEPLGVHSNTYYYVLLVKTLYRPQCICFLRSLAIRVSYFGTQQQTVGTCTGHTASMLYATGSKLLLRHLQTTKEIPHVVVISLSLSLTYIGARTLTIRHNRLSNLSDSSLFSDIDS